MGALFVIERPVTLDESVTLCTYTLPKKDCFDYFETNAVNLPIFKLANLVFTKEDRTFLSFYKI